MVEYIFVAFLSVFSGAGLMSIHLLRKRNQALEKMLEAIARDAARGLRCEALHDDPVSDDELAGHLKEALDRVRGKLTNPPANP